MAFHVIYKAANGDRYGVVVRDEADAETAKAKAWEAVQKVCRERTWDPSEFSFESVAPYVERMRI